MSTYRRSVALNQAQRWNPRTGDWIDCEFNEPETRVRKLADGMVVIPVADFHDPGPPVLLIGDLITALRGGSP